MDLQKLEKCHTLPSCEECRSPSVLNPSIFKTAKTSRQRASPKVRSSEHAPQHGLVVPHGLSSSLGLHQIMLLKGYWPNAAGQFFPRHTLPVNFPRISLPSKCSRQFCNFMESIVWSRGAPQSHLVKNYSRPVLPSSLAILSRRGAMLLVRFPLLPLIHISPDT